MPRSSSESWIFVAAAAAQGLGKVATVRKSYVRQALEMHAQGPLHQAQERWSAPKKDRPAPASIPYLCV